MHACCSLAYSSSKQGGGCNAVSCISMPTRLARGKQLGNLRAQHMHAASRSPAFRPCLLVSGTQLPHLHGVSL